MEAPDQYLPGNAESEVQAVELTVYDGTHTDLLKVESHHLWDVFSLLLCPHVKPFVWMSH